METKKILIVDDKEQYCQMLKANLEENQYYKGLIATSGKQALALVRQQQPDMVLLDILMPGMDGIECLKQIKAIAPDLPVVMVTAVCEAEEGRRAFQAGAYEYITKPVDFHYLETALFLKLLC